MRQAGKRWNTKQQHGAEEKKSEIKKTRTRSPTGSAVVNIRSAKRTWKRKKNEKKNPRNVGQ